MGCDMKKKKTRRKNMYFNEKWFGCACLQTFSSSFNLIHTQKHTHTSTQKIIHFLQENCLMYVNGWSFEEWVAANKKCSFSFIFFRLSVKWKINFPFSYVFEYCGRKFMNIRRQVKTIGVFKFIYNISHIVSSIFADCSQFYVFIDVPYARIKNLHCISMLLLLRLPYKHNHKVFLQLQRRSFLFLIWFWETFSRFLFFFFHSVFSSTFSKFKITTSAVKTKQWMRK